LGYGTSKILHSVNLEVSKPVFFLLSFWRPIEQEELLP
jgi:hypothetical protein